MALLGPGRQAPRAAASGAARRFQLGNAAACLTALDSLRARLPVTAQDLRSGLLQTQVAGRFEVLPGRPLVILDVAHNPHAARALAANLASMPAGGRTLAVFAMLNDKDIDGVIAAVKDRIYRALVWWLPRAAARAASAEPDLRGATLRRAGVVRSAPVAQFTELLSQPCMRLGAAPVESARR